MRKGNKSEYLQQLSKEVADTWNHHDSLPTSDLLTVYLIDAMAFLQRFQSLGASTFNDLQTRYLRKILQMKPTSCGSVHLVGDRYDVPLCKSLKGDERLRRKTTDSSPEFVITRELEVPEWKQFMSNPKNKANLLHFVASCWEESPGSLPETVTIVVGGMFEDAGKTVELKNSGTTEIRELACTDHEEADTRLMAHLAYCSENGFERAIVQATDTDICVLCLYHGHSLEGVTEVWVEKTDRFLPIHSLLDCLSQKYHQERQVIASALLAVYVLTGCDTVSYPFKKGKRKAAKVALAMCSKLPMLCRFGSDLSVTEDVVREARDVFVALYGKEGFGSLNTLRQHIFASSHSDLRALPPTEASFQLHLLRALFQLAVCKRAHQNMLALPPPTEFGRKVTNGKLIPIMMSNEPRPSQAANPVFCKCEKSRCLRNCSCARHKVPCIIGCKCLGDPSKCGRLQELESDED